mmetsp:Transcript_126637/g.394253  ORF Transcript_126637/g.394253 Transcript_126637/m.394253 type:complete len:213 (-) Transcript_126637:323-961(-)
MLMVLTGCWLQHLFHRPRRPEITAGSVPLRSPEVITQSSWVGKEVGGVHDTTFLSLTECDVDFGQDLNAFVVLFRASFFDAQMDSSTESSDKNRQAACDISSCSQRSWVSEESGGSRATTSVSISQCDVDISGGQCAYFGLSFELHFDTERESTTERLTRIIHATTFPSYVKCDGNIIKDLCANVVLPFATTPLVEDGNSGSPRQPGVQAYS